MKGFGSLPWFCAVWWYGLAVALHGLALALFRANIRASYPLIWKLVGWGDNCTSLAHKCAEEAGMKELN